MAEVNVRKSLKRDLPWILGFSALLFSAFLVTVVGFGYDSHAYWLAIRGSGYSNAPNTPDAYLYSPAFTQVLWPLGRLPWPLFNLVWMAFAGITLAYLLKPLGWRLSVPLWFACTPEIVSGNIFWMFALVVAFGFRYPWLWSVVVLTKITPAVGPIWFAVRREWKKFLEALIVTTVIVSVSVAFDLGAWRSWFDFLQLHLSSTTSQVGGYSPPPVIRIPLAFGLVVWGAAKSRIWTIPAAMALATPVFGVAALVVFAGLPRLQGNRLKNEAVNPIR